MGLLDLLPVKTYAVYAVAVSFALLCGGLVLEHYRLKLAEADLSRMQVELGVARDANNTNADAISRLKTANDQISSFATAQAIAADIARQSLASAALAADAERAKAKKDLQDERSRQPSCDALLSQDLGSVCPLLRDRLFHRSEALRPH